MAIDTKITTIDTSVDDIRDALNNIDNTLGLGTINTIADEIRGLNIPVRVFEQYDDNGTTKYRIRNIYLTDNTCLPSQFMMNDTNVIAVWLPKSVTKFGSTSGEGEQFRSCTNLQYINLDNITNFYGGYNLYGCPLKFINIDNLKNPPQSTGYNFANNSVLKEVTYNGTTVRQYMFNNNSNVVTANIPNAIQILTGGFNQCTALIDLNWTPSKITSIGANAFSRSKIPFVLNLPNYGSGHFGGSGTGGQNGAFRSVPVQRVENLGKATEIGVRCFQDCTSLTSVILPSTVTVIRNYAFNGCTALQTFTLQSATPPTISSATFTGTTCTFYVPYSSDHSILSAYQTATNWSSMASRIVESNNEAPD